MTRSTDVLVVGGGVIGVCAAYALQERGVRTTLVERGEICSGASHGNGGWIFPSESAPIPGPGVIRKSLPWLIDPESPLYIRLRPSLSLMRWMWRFIRRECFAVTRVRCPVISLDERLVASTLELSGVGVGRRGPAVGCRAFELFAQRKEPNQQGFSAALVRRGIAGFGRQSVSVVRPH